MRMRAALWRLSVKAARIRTFASKKRESSRPATVALAIQLLLCFLQAFEEVGFRQACVLPHLAEFLHQQGGLGPDVLEIDLGLLRPVPVHDVFSLTQSLRINKRVGDVRRAPPRDRTASSGLKGQRAAVDTPNALSLCSTVMPARVVEWKVGVVSRPPHRGCSERGRLFVIVEPSRAPCTSAPSLIALVVAALAASLLLLPG